jgi:DNA-binding beta-propeller fold protein YncE
MTTMTIPIARRLATLLCGAIPVLSSLACAKPPGQIFPPVNPPVAWPGPPDPPRIRYVGKLAVASDLKPAVPFGKAVSRAIFGKAEDNAMLTPFALCTDDADRLFVTDSNAQVVHVFNLNTRAYRQWMLPNNRHFAQPVGIAYDRAGRRLFVADSVAQSVYVFDDDGQRTAEWRAGAFERPAGLAWDAADRRLFVADVTAHQVVVLSDTGAVLQRIGERGEGPGQFNFPTAVTLDSDGRLYVCDALNWRVQVFNKDLRPVGQIGRKGDMPGYFSQPKGLATDAEGHLYVLDANFEAVQIFDPAGTLLLTFGEEGRNPGQFWLPTGIFIDGRNRIWIADSYNRRVQVFEYLPGPQPSTAEARP